MVSNALREFISILIKNDPAWIDARRGVDPTALKEDLLAKAAEMGYALSGADFEPAEPASDELSEGELSAVAGAGECYCAVGGGGTDSAWYCNGGGACDTTCACVVGGAGYEEVDNIYCSDDKNQRCVCIVGGYGEAYH